MEFNKCYALHLYERPDSFLSATREEDHDESEPPEGILEIISPEGGLENVDEETYLHSIWKMVAGLDDEFGSISFKGQGYDEPYYLKTVNHDMLRMKAYSASNGLVVFK